MLLFSAHRPMMFYISTKFYENILDGIKVKERTRFLLEKKKQTKKNNKGA